MVFLKASVKSLTLIREIRLLSVRCIGNISYLEDDVCHQKDTHTSLEKDVDTFSQTDHSYHKRIPLTVDEFKYLKNLKPAQPVNPHLLKVSIVGEPNVGKSTLANSLAKWKVCAVSSKVHTTRKKAAAILVKENKQIVFLDTPGFVSPEQSKKHLLEPSFIMDPINSVHNADIIAVVVDIANKYTNNRIDVNILELLELVKEKKSILILNKIDAMKSKDRTINFIKILTGGIVGGIPASQFEKLSSCKELTMEKIIHETNKGLNEDSSCKDAIVSSTDGKDLRGWTSFSRVFMVSALQNKGIDDLRDYLFSQALPNEWMYHDSRVTDQHPHDIAKMIVREKLLEYLPQEIPYQVKLKISKWEILSSGCPKIDIKIECANSRHKRFIIGPTGKHIAGCADKARRAMREAFRKDVVLHLAVE